MSRKATKASRRNATEKIVEAYVRYVKGWATIPNLRCAGQKEIDLFAIISSPERPVPAEEWMLKQVQHDGGIILRNICGE